MKSPRTDAMRSMPFDAKMTPMIDVIFQLLIFFLCTAGFAIPEAVLPTELPREGAVSLAPPKPREDTDIIRVHLDEVDGALSIRLNDRILPNRQELLEDLKRIAEITPRAPVVLDVEGAVKVGDVIAVYDGTLSCGLRNIHFAATRPPNPDDAP